jgi:4-amino-4-deoxy-L-arabinose transferase-like glycosyltransferase
VSNRTDRGRDARPPTRRRIGTGVLIVGASLVVNLCWALAVKPLDAPDEPAHLQAIRQVQLRRMLPEVHYSFARDPSGEVVRTFDDPATRYFAMRAGILDEFKLEPYESMQPPLYYLIAGLAASPFGTNPVWTMVAGRVVSACLGAAAVGCLWLAVRRLAPSSPILAVAAAGFVGLLPQYSFNSSSVSNDSAVNFAAALSFAVWIGALRKPEQDPRLLRSGAVVGLALLAKLNALALVPGLGLLVVFRAWPGPSGLARVGRVLRLGAWAMVGLLAVSGWWFARNFYVYDGDPSGSREAIRFYRANFKPLSFWSRDDWALLRAMSWESFWGRFGWLTIRLPGWRYVEAKWAAGLLLGLSTWTISKTWRALDGTQVRAGILLATVFVTLLASYLQFNFSVAFQSQSRYLFPAILPLALALTGGLATLPTTSSRRSWAVGVLLVWMASLNLSGLWKVGP